MPTCGAPLVWHQTRDSFTVEATCERCTTVHREHAGGTVPRTCPAPTSAAPTAEPAPAYIEECLAVPLVAVLETRLAGIEEQLGTVIERLGTSATGAEDAKLGRELVAILGQHVEPGPDGRGEGAVQVLRRIIDERRKYRAELNRNAGRPRPDTAQAASDPPSATDRPAPSRCAKSASSSDRPWPSDEDLLPDA